MENQKNYPALKLFVSCQVTGNLCIAMQEKSANG